MTLPILHPSYYTYTYIVNNITATILNQVLQTFYAKDNNSNNQELINFKLWLVTLAGVTLAILFALVGSIFAIINFVMTPRGTLTGPVGLVTWNAIACK